jgi:hypothetical protein
MLPNMEAALAHKVSVVVVTRPANADRENDRPILEKTLATFQGAGVRLLFKPNIHQKFAVIDRKIVWYGSINLLGYGNAKSTSALHPADRSSILASGSLMPTSKSQCSPKDQDSLDSEPLLDPGEPCHQKPHQFGEG